MGVKLASGGLAQSTRGVVVDTGNTDLYCWDIDARALENRDIRLLVLDIDGTLGSTIAGVSQEVRAAIAAARAAGVELALATGRSYQSALGFHELVGSALPLTCYDGALLRDPRTGVTHRSAVVPGHVVERMFDVFEDTRWRDRVCVHVHVDADIHARTPSPVSTAYLESGPLTVNWVEDLRAVASASGCTRLMVFGEDVATIAELHRELSRRDQRPNPRLSSPIALNIARVTGACLCADVPDINKAVAVRHLAEDMLALRPEQVMAIGDDLNDREMLAYAGLGVAMGHAPAALEAVADWLAPSLDAHGVAAAIERWILRSGR